MSEPGHTPSASPPSNGRAPAASLPLQEDSDDPEDANEEDPQGATDPSARRGLPTGVWRLGFVSLLMDTSTEMAASVLPVFLTTTLGASVLAVGLIEGFAQGSGMLMRLVSGLASDRFRQRKSIALAGYLASTLAKPLLPLATGVQMVFIGRLADRLGKGIRVAPRNALLTDLAPRADRGAAFGLAQALDTVGACLGPLAAAALMAGLGASAHTVLWVAVAPAVLAVLTLALGVQDLPGAPEQDHGIGADQRANADPPSTESTTPPCACTDSVGDNRGSCAHPPDPKREEGKTNSLKSEPPGLRWRDLDSVYRSVVLGNALVTMARLGDAFVLLRLWQGGMPLSEVPLVIAGVNLVFAATAYPVGRISDRIGRTRLLGLGLTVLLAADCLMALGEELWLIGFGAGLFGLHKGLTESLLATRVADAAPPLLRATAFGVQDVACASALLAANGIAGWLWDRWGPMAAFGAGAAFSLLALASLVSFRGDRPRTTEGV